MNPDPNQAKAIFLEAVEKHAPDDWPAFLDRACPGQPDLRRRVEVLLEAHVEAGTAQHQMPEAAAPVPTTAPESAEELGAVIGPYKLIQEIGEGGMGTVYMAQQTEPVKRRVALKLIKPGMDSRQVIARFEAERQALALMDHPNIARVFDAGTTKGEPGGVSPGRPYFVMELVKGVPLTKYCDAHRLTPKERLELFIPVCQAIQHAHQKGIIHRDIKPSNVLVALYDGKPVPKVIDFGVAKAAGQQLTEHTLVTGFGAVVGTLEYMSPEQAELNQLDIDTRSDIYSLGVLLYELLTGTTPLDRKRLKEATVLELLRIIREEEPPRPSTRLSTTEEIPSIAANRGLEPKKLSGLVRGELDWIVIKALEKDRNRRYETANGFARDVQRYLADEPVPACPPSAWYRFRKFARRNKGPLLAAALVLLALVGGIVGTTWGMIRAEAAKVTAEEREAETNAVLDFVENKVFAAARPKDLGGGQGYDIKLSDAVKAALPFVDQSFTGRPLIEARLRRTMGISFSLLGDANTAREQLEAARQLYIEHRGPDHPDTIASMNDLAVSYAEAGRIQDAIKLYEETLRLAKARLGPDDRRTLTSIGNLARAYFAAGRIEEAVKLHEETLRLRKAKLGPDDPDTLSSMSNVADSYLAAGRREEAVQLHEETLRLQKAKLGPDHYRTLGSMDDLASAYLQVGRAQEALKLREELLPLRKARFGPDHPLTFGAMVNLASAYTLLGRPRDAIKLLEAVLPVMKVKMPDHRFTLICMHNLAFSYSEAGCIPEALKLGEETVRLQKAKLGPDHPHTLLSMMHLANSYERAGRDPKALKLREETLRLQKAKLGPHHPDTLASMYNVAVSYTRAGLTQEALKLFKETFELMRAKLGPDQTDTLTTMNGLANSYAAAGCPQDALKLREETAQLMKAKFGPDSFDTLMSMNNLADSYIHVTDVAKALAILQDTLRWRERRVKAEPGNSEEQSFLAWTHGQMGQAEEARYDHAAAVQAYARSADMFDKLDRAGVLRHSFFRERMSFYRQRLALCRKAEIAVKDLDFALRQPAGEVSALLDLRVRYLLKEQKLPAAVESAAKMKERASDQVAQLYDAACAYALCAAAAKQAKTPVAAAYGFEKLAQEAMALLEQAVARGYKNAAHMKQDRDLDALRERADFQKLLAKLETAK
jgi:serine/threonine protein kinase/tetratricopeptide (TPR) repeat protein